MKSLIRQILAGGMSRRNFLSSVGAALGLSVITPDTRALEGPADRAEENTLSNLKPTAGSGGALLVAQLKAAGVEYIFFSPTVAQVPIYDALIDEPGIQLIQSLHEGALIAMANGYAKASGKTPFVLMTRPGLVNSVSQIFNTFKDRVPTIVGVDWGGTGTMGMDGHEDIDDLDQIVRPVTKWHWIVETSNRIPDVTRRAYKFASTAPAGPVLVGYPKDKLREQGQGAILEQIKFTVPMQIRPDPALVQRAARLLLNARCPLLYVGDEIVQCAAEQEVIELAELLGLPVTRGARLLSWSMPFPTRHSLYLGAYQRNLRYPAGVDVFLNLGGRMPYPTPIGLPNADAGPEIDPSVHLIQVRLDSDNLAREYPTEVPIVADVKHAAADLVAAIRMMASPSKLREIADSRTNMTREYTAKARALLDVIARRRWDRSPISVARLGVEMEQILDKDTIYVAEPPSGAYMDPFLSFGGADKQYISHVGGVLGWGVSAAFGVKLAQPNRPVVAVVGDGAFQFMGPQPLWSFARYKAPVIVIVVNNAGMNGQRSGAMAGGGRQLQMGLNTGFYLGDPDMDFAKMAAGFGVEGETVREPTAFRPALERAKLAAAAGRPYLLDVHTERTGLGGASSWHPSYSIAALRNRRV